LGLQKNTRKYTQAEKYNAAVEVFRKKAMTTTITVPSNAAYSNTSWCYVLQVSYQIEVTAARSKVAIPVIISAVPLRFEEAGNSSQCKFNFISLWHLSINNCFTAASEVMVNTRRLRTYTSPLVALVR
jgi:hypothetical protein